MRKILHIDCDCFFAAVEMRDNPSLQHIPLAIGGRSDRRGVIATCNYPARQYGVHSAMATALAVRKCPDLVLLPGDMSRYKLASKQVMDVIQQYGIACEQVSIDEAYVELNASDNAIETAKVIRSQVQQQVGITVSVGVAENKFLAKVASDWRKPNGLFAVKPHQVAAFVAELEVRKIPGVGPKTAERLKREGIVRCIDAHAYSSHELSEKFGRLGVLLHQRCQGLDDRPLNLERTRKTLSVERTFPEDLASDAQLLAALPELWQRWRQRLESSGLNPDDLEPFVKVKFADFQQTTLAAHRLHTSLKDFQTLLLKARQRSHHGVRLIGLGGRCRNHDPLAEQQLSLAF